MGEDLKETRRELGELKSAVANIVPRVTDEVKQLLLPLLTPGRQLPSIPENDDDGTSVKSTSNTSGKRSFNKIRDLKPFGEYFLFLLFINFLIPNFKALEISRRMKGTVLSLQEITSVDEFLVHVRDFAKNESPPLSLNANSIRKMLLGTILYCGYVEPSANETDTLVKFFEKKKKNIEVPDFVEGVSKFGFENTKDGLTKGLRTMIYMEKFAEFEATLAPAVRMNDTLRVAHVTTFHTSEPAAWFRTHYPVWLLAKAKVIVQSPTLTLFTVAPAPRVPNTTVV